MPQAKQPSTKSVKILSWVIIGLIIAAMGACSTCVALSGDDPPAQPTRRPTTPTPTSAFATLFIEEGCNATEELRDLTIAFDAEGLLWRGEDLFFLMSGTRDAGLDVQAEFIRQDMVSFGELTSERRYDILLGSIDTYLLLCESILSNR